LTPQTRIKLAPIWARKPRRSICFQKR